MNEMITGAAIGFLLWATLAVLAAGRVIHKPGYEIHYPALTLFLVIHCGTGAAIGWLVS